MSEGYSIVELDIYEIESVDGGMPFVIALACCFGAGMTAYIAAYAATHQ